MVTLCPSLKWVVSWESRSCCYANVDGEKKVMKKQRRSKEMNW
jgi:hypothetical protein